MKTHELKLIQPYFDAVKNGTKTFELRRNDRYFKVGDKVILKEYDWNIGEYKGNEIEVSITCVLESFVGLEEGYCIFSFVKLYTKNKSMELIEQHTEAEITNYSNAIGECFPNTLKNIENKIMGVVSEMEGVSVFDIQKTGRKKEHVQARQLCMYFLKEFSNYSLKKIGSIFSGRDHSTVIHAIEKVNNYLDTEEKYRKLFAEIEVKVKQIL